MARTCYICTFDEMMMRSTLSRPTLEASMLIITPPMENKLKRTHVAKGKNFAMRQKCHNSDPFYE